MMEPYDWDFARQFLFVMFWLGIFAASLAMLAYIAEQTSKFRKRNKKNEEEKNGPTESG